MGACCSTANSAEETLQKEAAAADATPEKKEEAQEEKAAEKPKPEPEPAPAEKAAEAPAKPAEEPAKEPAPAPPPAKAAAAPPPAEPAKPAAPTKQPTVTELNVPADWSEGQALKVTLSDGRAVQVPVPAEIKAGGSFKWTVPPAQKSSSKDLTAQAAKPPPAAPTKQPTVTELKVPPDWTEGLALKVKLSDGRAVQVAVPPEVKAGGSFKWTVPQSEAQLPKEAPKEASAPPPEPEVPSAPSSDADVQGVAKSVASEALMAGVAAALATPAEEEAKAEDEEAKVETMATTVALAAVRAGAEAAEEEEDIQAVTNALVNAAVERAVVIVEQESPATPAPAPKAPLKKTPSLLERAGSFLFGKKEEAAVALVAGAAVATAAEEEEATVDAAVSSMVQRALLAARQTVTAEEEAAAAEAAKTRVKDEAAKDEALARAVKAAEKLPPARAPLVVFASSVTADGRVLLGAAAYKPPPKGLFGALGASMKAIFGGEAAKPTTPDEPPKPDEPTKPDEPVTSDEPAKPDEPTAAEEPAKAAETSTPPSAPEKKQEGWLERTMSSFGSFFGGRPAVAESAVPVETAEKVDEADEAELQRRRSSSAWEPDTEDTRAERGRVISTSL